MGKAPEDIRFHKKRDKPNIFSKFFFLWMCPVIWSGNKRDVEESDLVVPSKVYDSKTQGDKLERAWFDELERAARTNKKPSLGWAICRAYWLEYMPGALFILVIVACRIGQPLLFARLLAFWTVDSDVARFEAGLYALCMLGLNFVVLMCHHHNTLFVMAFSLRVKIAGSALLYRKLLRINQVSSGNAAGGKLVNLLSNDMTRFDYAFMLTHYLWIVPIQVAVVMYFLYNVGGYAPFVGLFGVIILITPLQAGLTKLTASIRRSVATRTDRRIKLMSEIINGIQVIKIYAWEKPFQVVVSAVRAYEMKALRNAIFVRSVILGFMLFTERTILFFTMLTLVLSGSMVSATTIYPIQQFLSSVQLNLTIILPMAIASLSELFVTLERMQSFLALDEKNYTAHANGTYVAPPRGIFSAKKMKHETPEIVNYKNKSEFMSNPNIGSPNKPSEFAVEISGVTGSWVESENETTLKNLSLRIRHGKLCAIIGPVGAGKTSLLQLLLKEMPTKTGTVSVNGSMSYSCQESWLFPATVRENIFMTPKSTNRLTYTCWTTLSQLWMPTWGACCLTTASAGCCAIAPCCSSRTRCTTSRMLTKSLF